MRLVIFILLFLSNLVYSQTPMLLKDFVSNGGGQPNQYIADGGFLYFEAYTDSGVNIFRTDGNIASTIPIFTNSLIDIMEFEIFNGKAYFSAYDNSYNLDLYVHDLTPGSPATKLPINPSGNSQVSNIMLANSRIYFNANTSSNGFQLCSIDPATNVLFIHVAPPPYSGGLIIEQNKAYPATGLKSIVQVNNRLIFNIRFGQNNLMSLDISGAPTNPIVIGPTSSNSFAPYPYNGKVYLYSDGDLISSDGLTMSIEATDIGPYYFCEFQNRLYFSGVPTASSNFSTALFSIDNSGTLREFPNIPTFGGTTTFNRFINDYSLVIIDGQLHSYVNSWPVLVPTVGLYSIDVSSPNTPIINLEIDEIPKELFNIKKINSFYYYWYLPFNTGNQQLKKNNGTNEVVIAMNVGDSYFKHFFYWQNDLYFTGKMNTSDFASCETFGPGYSVGNEWFKLSESQLFCQANRIADNAFFQKDNILASQSNISINDPILLNTNSCHILSSPNLSINNTLQVNSPAMLITNLDGCQ